MTLTPYIYTLQTRAGQGRNGVNITSNAGLLNWNSRGYRQSVSLYRTTREQRANQLLTGSRATLNAGFRNSGKLVCIKFEKRVGRFQSTRMVDFGSTVLRNLRKM